MSQHEVCVVHLLHGNLDPGEGCLVSFRALKESAIPAQDLILVIPGHPAECLVDVHQRAVWQVRVSDGDSLHGSITVSFQSRRQSTTG